MLENGKHLFYEENEFSKLNYNLDFKLVYDNI